MANRVRVESWAVSNKGKAKNASVQGDKKVVTKIAVRDAHGRFHGATNFRGSVLS